MAATLFKLRSTTHGDSYHEVRVVAPSGGYTAGQMVKINDIVGVIVETAAIGVTAVLVYMANKIVVPCAIAATAGYAVGEKVYFDATNAEVTETASGNTLCGIVAEASSVGDEELMINLNGMLGIVA